MIGEVTTGAFAPSDPIVSMGSARLDALHSDRKTFGSSRNAEQKLVNSLTDSGCRLSRILARFGEADALGTSIESARARFPTAWSLLVDLIGSSGSSDIVKRLDQLLHCLVEIGQPATRDRSGVSVYLERMQLYAMLPIYLCVDHDRADSAVDESMLLLYAGLALIDLDEALGSELFELLTESPYQKQSPRAALQQSLKIDLCEMVEEFGSRWQSPANRRMESARHGLSSERSEGLWSIVEQWTSGAAHLQIPRDLAIGKVRWPSVREHWSRLSHALVEDRSARGHAIHDQHFIEIRSSQDSQLVKTLDIQLQRCRRTDSSMALVIIQALKVPTALLESTSEVQRLPRWQEVFIAQLRRSTEGQTTHGFTCEAGELALIIDDLDRSELTVILRDALEVASQSHTPASPMVESPPIPIACGMASVTSPSKGFQIEQLINTAWRCLDAAKLQGPGAIKSLEVF